MHLILVSNRMATARTITITPRLVLAVLAGLFFLMVALSSLFSYVTVRHAAEIQLPFLQKLIRAITFEDSQRNQEFVRENLKVMATRLGEMQAQLIRLDTLGDRLATQTGIRVQDIKPGNPPVKDGRGGPLILSEDVTVNDLSRAVDDLVRQVEVRTDTLSLIESQMFEERVRKSFLPTTLPVNVQWNASAFGWRVDPFTGMRAMHEGVDFPAEVGTPIVSAAAGRVIFADRHPEYGNMIEIDHGNDMTTRYAHASKLLVKEGDVVKRGQLIAEVGSTGRSTGPHLHFETRFRGAAQNPNRFLQQAQANTLAHR